MIKKEYEDNVNDLKLLKDIPEFESEYDKKLDKFNHKAYADLLVEIINENEAPLVIGLLGEWGTGKTTILNLFQKEIGDKYKDKYKSVYFNAWKYANDSFRRQFLIETAEALLPNKIEKEKYVEKLNYRFIRDIDKQFMSNQKLFYRFKNIKLNIDGILLSILILVLTFGAGYIIYSNLSRSTEILNSIIALATLFPISWVIQKILKASLSKVFSFTIKPQLIFPEQFEKEFNELITKYNDNKKIIFIIDDIDRCPPHMIMDILDASKTFFVSRTNKESNKKRENENNNKCYYIIAMDDKAVTTILENNRSQNYKQEEILKFFDTTLRLNPIRHSDLIEFSKLLASNFNIPEVAVQIAIFGGFYTPRKIKHFLNNFKVIYSLAKKRAEEGIFNIPMEKIAAPLAKMLVLQLSFSSEFIKLKENPELLNKWEETADEKFGRNISVKDENEVKENKNNKNGKNNENNKVNEKLLKFLWVTKDTKIIDIDGFLHLKIPQYAINLPNYSKLKDTIINGDLSKLKELLENIRTKEEKKSLVDLILELLDIQPSGYFLENILSSSLEIFKGIEFETNEKYNISNIIIRHLERYKDILKFDPEIVFNLIDNLNERETYENRIVELSIESLSNKPESIFVSKFINILYKKEIIEKKISLNINNINEIMKKLVEKDPHWAIQVFKNIELPKGSKYNELSLKIPSPDIISSLLQLIDKDEDKTEFYKDIFDISVKFPDDSYKNILSERCMNILNYWSTQPINKLNSNLNLIINIINDMPYWITEDMSNNISNSIWNIYNKISDNNEKYQLLEIYCISSFSEPNNQRNVSKIINSAIVLDLDNFKKFIEFLNKYYKISNQDNWWLNLKRNIINQVIDNITNTLNEINMNKFEFIYSNERKFISEENIKNILIRVFQNNSQVIQLWKNVIIKAAKDSLIREWIIEKLINLIRNPSTSNYEQKGVLLNLLIKICKILKVKNIKLEVGNLIFELVKNSNINIRSLGLNKLKESKELLGSVFDMKINSEVQELCKKPTNDVIRDKQLLLKYLEFQDVWVKETWDYFMETLKNLITTGDQSKSNIQVAIELIDNIRDAKRIPEKKREGIKNIYEIVTDQHQKEELIKLIKEKFK